MKKILVTGGNGQLGRCLKKAAKPIQEIDLRFVDIDELNITRKRDIDLFFEEYKPDYCVNAAAYTNVEKAESESDLAFEINATGAKNIAYACKESGCVLIHISTDYVFDGKTDTPYAEDAAVNPINEYGKSKLAGEEAVMGSGCDYFILRTSWLYSQFGHNFYRTVLRVAGEGKPLTVTTEQTGVPTNANDLAAAILQIIVNGSEEYGLYHFSNAGRATWYDFAERILSEHGLLEDCDLAKTNHYRTFAARPLFSVLNTDKLRNTLGIEIRDWKESLGELVKENNTTN